MDQRYPVSPEAGDEDLSKAVQDTEPQGASGLRGDPSPSAVTGLRKRGGAPRRRSTRESAPQSRRVIREDM